MNAFIKVLIRPIGEMINNELMAEAILPEYLNSLNPQNYHLTNYIYE